MVEILVVNECVIVVKFKLATSPVIHQKCSFTDFPDEMLTLHILLSGGFSTLSFSPLEI